ncbi:MAG TPA: YjgP/YjgQ family permease [Deltaproteobacteria bacterium]|nr:YjgP/YjgQ family permease [Deltaproteobacteria bacterium]
MHPVEIAQGENGTREGSTQIPDATIDFQALSSFARMIAVRILSHYFVARYLGLFATVLIAALLVLATIELVFHLDDLSDFGSNATLSAGGFTPGRAIHYLWIRLASYYLVDLLPIASFIAAFVTWAWAGRSVELVAIQSGGIRLSRIVLPVLGAAFILSCAAAILHETLVLHAKRVWAAEIRKDRDDLSFGREVFWYKSGRRFANIRFADPDSRTLYGVEIFELGPEGRVRRVIRAEIVRVSADGRWEVDDARIWRFDPKDPAAPPDLSDRTALVLDMEARGGETLLSADPGVLSLVRLADHLARHPRDPSSAARRWRGQFHERLSRPWLILVFAWLALPFALLVDERGRIGGPAVAAAASLGLWFVAQSAGSTLARQGLIPTGLTPWLLIAFTAVATAIALRRRPL